MSDTVKRIRKEQQLNDGWIAEYIYMAVNISAKGLEWSKMVEEVIELAKKRYAKEVSKLAIEEAFAIKSAPSSGVKKNG